MAAWYEEWFGDDYITLYNHRDEEESVKFIKTLQSILKLKKGHKILDLCCGAGRYSIELAKVGYEVTGIDLSEDLIKTAHKNTAKNGLRIDYHIRDMRDIRFVNHFDGVVNMFTSFGYFRKDEENTRVIGAVYKSLTESGWFVLDFMNKESTLEKLQPYDESVSNGIKVIQKRRYDIETGRIEKEILINKGGVQKGYNESVRLFSIEELRAMFWKIGFEIIREFGDYNGTDLINESPRVIIIGKKQ